jgi:hypothetical protein
MKKTRCLLKLSFLTIMININQIQKLINIEKFKEMNKLCPKLLFKDSHNIKEVKGNKKVKDNSIKMNKQENFDKQNSFYIMQNHKSKDKDNIIIIRNRNKVFRLNKI